jgi:adenosyl cobinamide kinase/adenosyl cobinamide phosphate guanylyltransferase
MKTSSARSNKVTRKEGFKKILETRKAFLKSKINADQIFQEIKKHIEKRPSHWNIEDVSQ